MVSYRACPRTRLRRLRRLRPHFACYVPHAPCTVGAPSDSYDPADETFLVQGPFVFRRPLHSVERNRVPVYYKETI